MNLRALIIDDEPLAHKVILEYASATPYLDIVGQCHLATEALVFLQQEEVDLIFLDIQMPKLKGLDFLRTLARKPLVIITSAYEEYALESFELAVCDYLLKPFRFDRFLKAVNRALAVKQMQAPAETTPPTAQPESTPEQLFIKSDKRMIQLDIADIHYLESYGNYVKVWLGYEFHLTPRTLSSFEDQMPADFHRIHKSYIINKKQIDYIEGNQVMMKNKKQIPIGKNHRQDVKGLIS
ncbi:MAG: LytTR family DNA-binding domain-containing protein [Saprospiraceae bacterium]|nr:LytTR family DNA-binding domain-containing protein [Saprospiraceae bacterium]